MNTLNTLKLNPISFDSVKSIPDFYKYKMHYLCDTMLLNLTSYNAKELIDKFTLFEKSLQNQLEFLKLVNIWFGRDGTINFCERQFIYSCFTHVSFVLKMTISYLNDKNFLQEKKYLLENKKSLLQNYVHIVDDFLIEAKNIKFSKYESKQYLIEEQIQKILKYKSIINANCN